MMLLRCQIPADDLASSTTVMDLSGQPEFYEAYEEVSPLKLFRLAHAKYVSSGGDFVHCHLVHCRARKWHVKHS